MQTSLSNKDASQNEKRYRNTNKATDLLTVLLFILIIFVLFLLSTFQFAIKLVDAAYNTTDNKINEFYDVTQVFLGNPSTALPYLKELIGWSNQVLINKFQLTLVNDVVIGKNGWLFINNSRSFDDYKGTLRYTDQELSVFSATLKSQKNWLSKQGIRLLLVFAPNKESIYPEFVPDGIRKANTNTRLDQLIKYLSLNSNVDLLDLRGPLLSEKDHYQLYYRTDSHWNSYGCYFAYLEIMKRLQSYFPGIEAYPIRDYVEKVDASPKAGDLAYLIMMQDSYAERRFHLENLDHKEDIAAVKIPSAVIFHDSFYSYTQLKPFISQHFERIAEFRYDRMKGMPFEQSIIEKEKPDIVIYVMVERLVPRYFLDGYDLR